MTRQRMLGLWVAGLVWTAGPLAAGGAERPLVEVLPAETIFYFRAVETRDSLARRQQTAIGKLNQEPEVQTFQQAFQKVRAQTNPTGSQLSRKVRQRIVETFGDLQKQPGRYEMAVIGLYRALGFPLPEVVVAMGLEGGRATGGRATSGRGGKLTGEQIDRFVDDLLDIVWTALPLPLQRTRVEAEVAGRRVKMINVQLGHVTLGICYAVTAKSLVVTLGKNAMARVLGALSSGAREPLTRQPSFITVREKLGPTAESRLVYLNVNALVKTVFDALGAKAPPQARETVSHLGLDGIKAVGFTGWIEQGGFHDRMYILAPRPRLGLAKLLDWVPLKAADYRDLPAETAVGLLVGLPLRELWREFKSTLFRFDPMHLQKLETGLQASSGADALGVNLEHELIGALGETVAFSLALPPGTLIPEATLSVALSDEAAFRKAHDSLAKRFAPGQLQKFAGENRPLSGLEMYFISLFGKQQWGEVTFGKTVVRYFAQPGLPVSPCYAIAGDRLVVSLSTTGLRRHLTARGGPKGTIRDSDVYASLLKRLPPDGTGVAIADLKGIFLYAYNMLLPFVRMGVMAKAQSLPFDVQGLLEAVPQAETVARHLSAVACQATTSPQGVTIESLSPFQASPVLVGAAVAGVGAGVLLPTLARARGAALATACLSNLKQIGLAMHMYAADHNESFPARLSDLYDRYATDTGLFACPVHGKKRLRKEEIDAKGDYVLVGVPQSSKPADWVLVYDRAPHRGGQLNVLFLDGHVRKMHRRELEKRLKKQNTAKKSGERGADFF